MRWYKTLTRTLLMLSVVNFALTAPVVVREHEVRVSVVDATKDGTTTWPLRRDPSDNWQVNMVDRTNAPPILRSPDSGYWREQEPTHNNPRSLIDSNGLPEPSKLALSIDLNADPTEDQSSSPLPSPGPTPRSSTSQARTDEPDLSNPGSSSPPGNTDLNPSLHQGLEPTDDSHALDPAPPSGSRPKPLPFTFMVSSSSPEGQTVQSPRLSLGPTPTTSSLTSQAPANERDPLNPGLSPLRNTALNPSIYLGLGPTDISHAPNTASPSGSRPKPVPLIDLTDSANDQIDQSPSPRPGFAPTSPSPTSQAPADEPDPLNPPGSSSSHHNTDLNPSLYQGGLGPTDDSHASNTASPSGSGPKPVPFIDLTDSANDQIDHSPSPPLGPGPTSPSLTSQAPADEPHPLNSGPSSPHDDSHTNPASPLRSPDPASSSDEDLNFRPKSSSQKFKTLSELMSTTPRLNPSQDESPQLPSSSDEAPQIPPSPDESRPSSSWVPTDSGSTSSGPPQRHVSPPASQSSSDEAPQIPSSPDESRSSSSWVPTDSGSTSSGPPQRYVPPPASQSSTEESYQNELDQPSPTAESRPLTEPTEEYYLKEPDQPSTGDSHPVTPTGSPPPPASASNPGPSTEPNPPPSAKRPRPGDDDLGSSLAKILKGKFKRRFSGSGALKAAQEDLQGT